MAAVDELHHADLAAGVARQPGMRRRVDVLRAHPVARFEAGARARLAIERAACQPLLHDVGREIAVERLARVKSVARGELVGAGLTALQGVSLRLQLTAREVRQGER